MGKLIGRSIFAALGIGLGVLLFSRLLVTEVQGSTMLPMAEPGDLLLAVRLTDGEDVKVGDLVVYEAPYYTINGEGRTLVRRVTGIRGDWLRVDCDTPTTRDQESLLAREEVEGKVILNFSKFRVTF